VNSLSPLIPACSALGLCYSFIVKPGRSEYTSLQDTPSQICDRENAGKTSSDLHCIAAAIGMHCPKCSASITQHSRLASTQIDRSFRNGAVLAPRQQDPRPAQWHPCLYSTSNPTFWRDLRQTFFHDLQSGSERRVVSHRVRFRDNACARGSRLQQCRANQC